MFIELPCVLGYKNLENTEKISNFRKYDNRTPPPENTPFVTNGSPNLIREVLKLPLEDIYRGGNSKSRNPHMQTMLRMVGFGDNAGSGFPSILGAWKDEGWVKPELLGGYQP